MDSQCKHHEAIEQSIKDMKDTKKHNVSGMIALVLALLGWVYNIGMTTERINNIEKRVGRVEETVDKRGGILANIEADLKYLRINLDKLTKP